MACGAEEVSTARDIPPCCQIAFLPRVFGLKTGAETEDLLRVISGIPKGLPEPALACIRVMLEFAPVRWDILSRLAGRSEGLISESLFENAPKITLTITCTSYRNQLYACDAIYI